MAAFALLLVIVGIALHNIALLTAAVIVLAAPGVAVGLVLMVIEVSSFRHGRC